MKKFIMTTALMLGLAVAGPVGALTVDQLVALGLSQSQAAIVAGLLGDDAPASTTGSFVYAGGLIQKSTSYSQQAYDLQSCLVELGVNSSNNVDGYFGSKTEAAVKAFQTANGLVPDGKVGQKTGPVYTEACAADAVVVVTPTTPTTPSNPSNPADGTEGEPVDFDTVTPEEDEIAEGQEEEIFAFEFDVEDGDIQISRLELYLESDSSASEDLDDYFKSFALTIDGDEVAKIDVDDLDSDDEEDYDVVTNDTTDEFRLRFTGLDTVVKEDKTVEVALVAEALNTIDDTDEGTVWTVAMDSDSLRYVDGTGFSEEEGDANVVDSFTIDSEETPNLEITLSDDTPDAQVIDVEDDTNGNDTEGVTILEFEVEEDQDVSVEEITEAVISLHATDAAGTAVDVSTVINKVELFVDGKEVGSESVAGANSGGAADELKVEFDNVSDFSIGGDKEVTVSVEVDFNDIMAAQEGTLVWASINSADFVKEAEDEFGNDENDFNISGTADGSGDKHEVRSEGIKVTFDDASVVISASDGADNDSATMTIEFSVEAFDTDAFIPEVVSDATAATVRYELETTAGTPVAAADGVITDLSDAEDNAAGDGFKISEGQTEEFRLTVPVNLAAAGNAGLYRIELENIAWEASDLSTFLNAYTFNLDDYKTADINLN